MQRKNRYRLGAVLASVALVAAACGGADDEPATATGAETATTEDAAATTADSATDTTESAAGTDPAATESAESTEAMGDTEETGTSGGSAADADVDRTVEVEMVEFGYNPSQLSFEAGETVRFVFTNAGAAPHEAVLGDLHVQEEHEQDMAAGMDPHDGTADGDDDGHHGEIPAITLDPGETGEFVHTFEEAGDLMLGCHIPGHWDAGMKADLEVAA